jgi:hypothetical protein
MSLVSITSGHRITSERDREHDNIPCRERGDETGIEREEGAVIDTSEARVEGE